MLRNLLPTLRNYYRSDMKSRHQYITNHYKLFSTSTESFVKRLTENEVELLKEALLEQTVIILAEICSETTNICCIVKDYAMMENEELLVLRMVELNNGRQFSFSSAELIFPEEMTTDKILTKKWRINKRRLTSVYTKMMVGISFAMEALIFEPKFVQDVLMIGLGGAVINNFLSTLGQDFMINLTTVELDRQMLTMATDWFQFVESSNNRVVIDDGVQFIHDASINGDKYKVILIDACYSDVRPLCCPVEEFYDLGTIMDISNVLEENGILSVNVLATSVKKGNEKDRIIALYKKFFTSCFYANISLQQQVLFCTHRKNWSYREQESRFLRNLQRVDETFEFELKDSYTVD